MSKSVLIFGGAGGIGGAIHLALSHLGFKTVIADINEPKGESARYYIACDVDKEEDVKRAIAFTQEKTGSLDVVINCQGIYTLDLLEETDLLTFEKMININLKSIFIVLRNIVPVMKWQNRGHIINIASMAGLRGRAGQSAYCASKFGVVGLTEAIYEELKGSNVHISAVCPASVDTPLLHSQVKLTKEEEDKILKPDDVARVIAEVLTSNPRVYRKIIPIDIDIDIDKLENKR